MSNVYTESPFVQMSDVYQICALFRDGTVSEVPESLSRLKMGRLFKETIPQGFTPGLAQCARMKQIERLSVENLTPVDVCNITGVFEGTRKEFMKSLGKIFLCKNKHVPEAFSFIVDAINFSFFILLKRRQSIVEGTFKKVRLAIALPFGEQLPPFLLVQKTNKRWKIGGHVDRDQSVAIFDNFRNEMTLNAKYLCTLAPLLVFCGRTTPEDPGMLRVLEPRLRTVHTFGQFKPSEEDWKQCSLSLTEGLLELHADNRIHGDIKSTNALWSRTSCGKIVCKWIDFGLSQKVSYISFRSFRLNNWYGSIDCTPPELLGKTLATPKKVFAVEAWALGYLLCTLMVGRPSWADRLLELYSKKTYITSAECESIIQEMSSFLMKAEARNNALTMMNRIRRVCLRLMAIDPEARLSLNAAKDLFETISKKDGKPLS